MSADLLGGGQVAGDGELVVHRAHVAHLARHLAGLGLELLAGHLAGEQHHAVVAVDVDAGVAEAGIGAAEVVADLGLDAVVLDLGAGGALAVVLVDGALVGHAGDGGTAGQSQQGGQEEGGEQGDAGHGDHSLVPKSCSSIRSHRQWITSR